MLAGAIGEGTGSTSSPASSGEYQPFNGTHKFCIKPLDGSSCCGVAAHFLKKFAVAKECAYVRESKERA
jgi:hypothetical protein